MENIRLKKKVLILSDGRMGHLNQSVAFANYMGAEYHIVQVAFRTRWAKGVAVVLDNLHFYTNTLYRPYKIPDVLYDAVVSAGSSTYYLTKLIGKKYGIKSIVMMLPKGYRYDFDLIFAQTHDMPPKRENIIEIPVNFSHVEPKGIYMADKTSVGIIIGGDNKVFTFSMETLEMQLEWIKKSYKDYEVALTTSPRTSVEVEKLVQKYGFEYILVYSDDPVNPIADFLEQCETVFITADSTSMISEAISYGKANVVILPLESSKKENKFTRFISSLQKQGYLHIFDGTVKYKNRKINFVNIATKVHI